MKNVSKLLLTSSAALLLAACGDTQANEEGGTAPEEVPTEQTDPTEETDETDETEAPDSAEEIETESVSVTMLTNDGEEAGTAIFEETADGVQIDLDLEELPEGEYGMHIHEVGMATPPTFEDAGSHFNPTDVEHGVDSESGPHVGDLPNLVVPEDGVVDEIIEIPDTTLQLDGENTLNSEEGTSLIVHTEADDYESQPTGDAGDRMLGGVIFPGTEE